VIEKPIINVNNGITEKQWMKLEQDGYCVFKDVIAKVVNVVQL
jgi:hypothetical protein